MLSGAFVREPCAEPVPAARLLEPGSRATLTAVAETLVPGAAAARVADYVEAMLSLPEPLLTYRFVGYPLSAPAFYREALAALDTASVRMQGAPAAALEAPSRIRLAEALVAERLAPWTGPPQALVYFVLRSDAIDAVYGTPAAYERAGVPYMAHINPPAAW